MFTYLRHSTNHTGRLIWLAPEGFRRSVGVTPHFDFTYPVTCLLGELETASQAEGFGTPCTCFALPPTQASGSFHRAEHGIRAMSMVSAPYALIQRGNGPSRGFALALRLEEKDALRAVG